MIKPKTITITRAEGFVDECDKPETATSWLAANAILRRWSETAPKTGGYDKCDFVIVFEDGEEYKGRYDLQHWTVETPDIAKHVRSTISYLSGKPPVWLKAPGKENYLRHYMEKVAGDAETVAEAKRWLATYDLGGGQ